MMTLEIRKQLGIKRGEVAHIIRHELRRRGYSDRLFAREVVHCSNVNVHNTINGHNHSPRVLDALRKVGIPAELLFDPRL